jgi:phage-related protein
MAEKNLFDQLKDVLQDFKTFLDSNVPTIKPAIQAIASLIPQVTELIDKLVGLMNSLKTEINKLDVNAIPGLAEASNFTSKIKTLLDAAESLLPDQKSAIDDVRSVADVVTGLPSLDAVKAEIISLIDAIVVHLNSLKA